MLKTPKRRVVSGCGGGVGCGGVGTDDVDLAEGGLAAGCGGEVSRALRID